MNLKELSSYLGLSQTTVSRALNGFPEVSEKTRQRVIEAAKAHGYMPSQSARGLATGRVGAIGHIIPLGKHQMINPHFSDFMAGVGIAYADFGVDIVMKICAQDQELATYRKMVKSNRVDGFVLQGPLVDDPRMDLLQTMGVPFVVHGRSAGATQPYNFLDVDNEGAFERATQFLIDFGHRDIALLNGLETMDFAHKRRKGFLTVLQGAGIPVRPELMFSQDMSEVYGYEVATNILALPNPPSAMLCASKLVALGVMRAIADAGLVAGKHVSVVTFDDDFGFLGTHAAVPQITCLRSSLYRAGTRVAHMMMAAVDDPLGISTEIWEPELVVGKSTGMKL
ncbi:LacI family transcriptional regulator [Amylibacter ulvae]|uniref:LacI family transcriptional regulator n=1 Tax=Paramylibacter ulvae TaxID=1651968 RepID=A0ABQ3D7T4_9RHOB|nr:substrate-binding domain-containing protein [Amylibacter ulvae]GHA57314.1 LacI family transcriptional regulator [Amylibacter ulvae]